MTEESKSEPKPKRLAVTMILAIVLGGIGHVYLGFLKKGLVIFFVGIALDIVLVFLIGYLGYIPAIAFWIWQIIDAYKTHKRLYPRTKALP